MITRHTSWRRLGAGVATGALVASSLLLAPSAATAATTTVTTADIARDASDYVGWHQGAANASGRHGVSSEGLKQVGKSQVIRGYADNSNTELRYGGVNANIGALVGAEYDVTAGRAFFQVPMFIDTDGKQSTPGVFATLRPEDGATSNTTIDGDDLWMVSKDIPDVDANTPTPLSELVAAINDRPYKTIAFGTFTDTGDTATVGSITFDGTTYDFSEPEATSTTVVNSDVLGVETDEAYTSWHQGYADSAARQFVGPNGLELDGRSQVIKGFDNNDADLDAVNASLASTLDDASFTVAAGSDDVSFQIPLRSDAIGGNQFTTLYTNASDAGVNELADASWQANKAIGSIPANTERPIEDFVAALGTYKVIGYGVLTNPGTSAVVSNVTFAGTSHDFVDAGPAASSETVSSFAPDESTYAGWHQGAATNTATISDDGLSLGTDKSQIINGYADNSADVNARNVDLNAALRSASYTVVSGEVFFQVPMFVDNDTPTPTFTTLRPSAAAVVGDNTISLDDEWVSSKAIPGVAANTPTRLGDILNVLGDYKVIGFGVFSDTGSNGVVKDITWNGVTYTFAEEVVVVEDTTIKPGNIKTKARNTYVKALIISDGDVEGGTVELWKGSVKLGTTTVGSLEGKADNYVHFKRGKLKKGKKYSYTLKYLGTETTESAEKFYSFRAR